MKHILIMGLLLTGACSSLTEGTSQQISVHTTPSGAYCNFIREGIVVAHIEATPGAATVQKDKHDITIECVKKGYKKASYFNKSGIAGGTFGNILLGGGIGWAIDSASGADNKYTGEVDIALVK